MTVHKQSLVSDKNEDSPAGVVVLVLRGSHVTVDLERSLGLVLDMRFQCRSKGVGYLH